MTVLSHLPWSPPFEGALVMKSPKGFAFYVPGYFSETCLDEVNMKYYLGKEVIEFFQLLSVQITMQFDTIASG
jgi:hypothetical protein